MDFKISFGNLLAFLVIGNLAASCQVQSTAEVDTAQQMKLYGDAHPYLDDSETGIRRAVPELRGLEPASSQDDLPGVLRGVGAQVTQLLRDLPNLVSNETVGQDVSYQDPNRSLPGHHPVQTPDTPVHGDKPSMGVKTFNYIVLVHESNSGRVLEEYRTDRKGKPVTQGPRVLSSVGFVSMWVVFSPANWSKCRFHYLGKQKLGGNNTFVIAFAQIPGVAYPGVISLPRGGTIPMLSQGVAWIDESDFRILRLRTDLLASQPQAGLNYLTALIEFGAVKIEKLDARLWLPLEVKTNLETNGRKIQELHRYAKFRLYKVDAKIVTEAH